MSLLSIPESAQDPSPEFSAPPGHIILSYEALASAHKSIVRQRNKSSKLKRAISYLDVWMQLAHIGQKYDSPAVNFLDVIKAVSAVTGISYESMQQDLRYRQLVLARQICYYIGVIYTNHNQDEMADYFHQERSAVSHANKTIRDLMDNDPMLVQKISTAIDILRQPKIKQEEAA
jgi:chromosomal replication initiation ATPase DnaA